MAILDFITLMTASVFSLSDDFFSIPNRSLKWSCNVDPVEILFKKWWGFYYLTF